MSGPALRKSYLPGVTKEHFAGQMLLFLTLAMILLINACFIMNFLLNKLDDGFMICLTCMLSNETATMDTISKINTRENGVV